MSGHETNRGQSAVAIAGGIRSGDRSAKTTLAEFVSRIEAQEEKLNCFNTLMLDSADQVAERIDLRVSQGASVGRLAGVPVAVKDNMCTAGVATTCSSKILEDWVPPYNATVVEKLLAEDALIIGKTNLDEFAMGSSTENSAFGPTLNPLDHSRVPGGSSGGSAAAVAADFAPVALGSDTGGSIRQPASLCGIVGMKPTYGSVSRYGLIAFASSLDQIGPLTKTVADSALVYDVIAGHDPLDSTSIAQTYESAFGSLGRGVEGLRVGVVSEMVADDLNAFEPEVLAATRSAVESLEASGAKLEEVSLPSSVAGLSAYYMIAPAEASSNLARYDGVRYGLRAPGANTAAMMTASRTAGFGDEVKRRIMLGTYALSAGYYDAFYGKAQRVRTAMINEFRAAFESYDLLIMPTSPCEAFEFGAKADPLTMYYNDVCTIPANLTGLPGISVPFGSGANGLPLGVQLMAPMLKEATMFQAAEVRELHRSNWLAT